MCTTNVTKRIIMHDLLLCKIFLISSSCLFAHTSSPLPSLASCTVSSKNSLSDSSPLLPLTCNFNKSGGTNTSFGLTLGTRKMKNNVQSRSTFLINRASHKFVKSVLVTCKALKRSPPPILCVKEPRLSMHMRSAKNVPSIPNGQSFVLKTIMGIHLIRVMIREVHSSMITKIGSGRPSFRFQRSTKKRSSMPDTPYKS